MSNWKFANNIFENIGNTPIVKINLIGVDCNVFGKAEFMNPTGSIKDRFVNYVLKNGMKSGLINKETTIIEATSGNTGIAIAAFGAIHGLKVVLVISEKISLEKINTARAFGAKVVVTRSDVEPSHPESYISVAKRMHAENPNSFLLNQYDNKENTEAHYHLTGSEIESQIRGSNIGAIFMGMGTAGTMSGIGRWMKEKRPDIKIICVDPVGSVMARYVKEKEFHPGYAKPYQLEGLGHHEVTKNVDEGVVDDVVVINDLDAFEMARRIARESGILAGGSSGGIVAGALKYVKENEFKKDILCVMPDSGNRYISKFFNDEWFEDFKSKFLAGN